MTTDRKDNLLDWLRDAHAMEQQAEQMLKAQSSRLEHYPDLKARIDLHLQETLGQQKTAGSMYQPPWRFAFGDEGPRRQIDGVWPGHRWHDHER